jgi:hypothetical protein
MRRFRASDFLSRRVFGGVAISSSLSPEATFFVYDVSPYFLWTLIVMLSVLTKHLAVPVRAVVLENGSVGGKALDAPGKRISACRRRR